MPENIFYFFGICIFLVNSYALARANTSLKSIEWLLVYKTAGRQPEKSRINYNLVILWLLSSVVSTMWLLAGLFTHDWQIFLFLSVVNFVSNYMLSKMRGQSKIRLTFTKSVVFNIILLSLILMNL